jgi:serine/threonine-protein kinase
VHEDLSTTSHGRSPIAIIAIGVSVVALSIAAGLWWFMQRSTSDFGKIAASPPGAAALAPLVSVPTVATPAGPKVEPGNVVISAAGWTDPADPRYQGDASKWQADLRADARGQLVDKALGLIADRRSLTSHYEAVSARLASRSGDFIRTVVRESEPVVGKDGLASMTTEAVVDVKAVQKSLNEMTAKERIDVIRASGDPRISIAVVVRDADRRHAPVQRSAVAENLLKERIKSFGFRTWSEDAPDAGPAADFSVTGETAIRQLSTRLAASGLVVTKYALTSWTIKAVDRTTGEEIYHDTTLPSGTGSYATEEEALKAFGGRVADRFSRQFFLSHVAPTTRRVALVVDGVADEKLADLLVRDLVGLPVVIAVRPRSGLTTRTFDLELAGSGAAADLVASGVLAPLNAKLGRSCLVAGAASGEEVQVRFDASCPAAEAIVRLETLPPAGLYAAPPSRQKAVIRTPETLRKLTV